jgi:hypothetical protein
MPTTARTGLTTGARMDRVLRVRSALSQSGPVAHRLLAERLSGIDLSVVGEILLSACKDIALVWGASILLGGAAGALIGFFGLGVGALPGGAAGAAFGAKAGAWVLGFLGLKALIEDLGTAIPDALRHYEKGFKLAWGPVRRWEQDEGTHRAPYELAEGHLVLMMAMLSALMAYLTRGRGDPRQGPHPAGDPPEPAAGAQGGRLGGGQRGQAHSAPIAEAEGPAGADVRRQAPGRCADHAEPDAPGRWKGR